jgi:hypothetical protein
MKPELVLQLSVTFAIAAAVTVPLTPSLWMLEHVSGSITHPALFNSALTFDFPQYPNGDWVNYLDVQYGNNLDISKSSYLTMTIRVTTTGAPNFRYDSNPDNTCSFPAHVRPYFAVSQSNPEYNSTGRWWSNPVAYQLAAGTVTLTIPLTPDSWSDVNGQFGNLNTTTISRFAATKAGVREIGMTFGGGCFFGHGVSVENGTAKFELLSYSVLDVAGPSILLLAPSTLPPATTGTTYTSVITASGGLPPYTFSLAAGSGLPAGLSFSTAGALSGIPANAGSYPFTVQVKDLDGATGMQAYVLNVVAGPCTYGISPGGQVFSSTGGNGTIGVTTNASCSWAITNVPSWVTFTSAASGTGSGTATFQLGLNSGPDQSAVLAVAGLSFTVEQQASSIAGMSFAGSMPHTAAAENWTTTFTMVANGSISALVRLSLFGNDGSLLPVEFNFPQTPSSSGPMLASSLDRTLAPHASLVLDEVGPSGAPVLVGSAQLAAAGSVDGFAIFHLIPGAQEGVMPMESRNASSYLLTFDNTGGVVLGVAVANVSTQSANIPVVIRDDTGTLIGPPGAAIALAGNGHTSFVLSLQYPVTANIRGTIEVDTPPGGQISVLGFRTTPLGSSHTLTTIPALANVGTNGGSIAHIATGNGWQTTFVLVNTGASAARAELNFFADDGSPLSVIPAPFVSAIRQRRDCDGFLRRSNAGGRGDADRAKRGAVVGSGADDRLDSAHH